MEISPPPPEETSPEHLPVVITFPVAQDRPPPRPSVASQHAPKTPEGERNRTREERRKARKRKQKRGYR